MCRACINLQLYVDWALYPRETTSHRILVARYWKDTRRFMLERFLSDWPKDAFIPFSQCIYPPRRKIVVMTPKHFCRRQCLRLPLGDGMRAIAVKLRAYSQIPFRFFETEGIAVMTTLLSR